MFIGGPSQSRRGKTVAGCCYSEFEPQVSRLLLAVEGGSLGGTN